EAGAGGVAADAIHAEAGRAIRVADADGTDGKRGGRRIRRTIWTRVDPGAGVARFGGTSSGTSGARLGGTSSGAAGLRGYRLPWLAAVGQHRHRGAVAPGAKQGDSAQRGVKQMAAGRAAA